MAYGRPAEWRLNDVTISEFYGLAGAGLPAPGVDVAAAAPLGTEMGRHPGDAEYDAASMLLSHSSFRRLFASISGDTYVSAVVAACYLGISKVTLERHLARKFGGASHWRAVLAAIQTADSRSPAMLGSKFRWSFMTGEVDPLLQVAAQEAGAKRNEKVRAARRKARGRPAPLLRLGDIIDSLLFVVDGRARIVGALGQGHISAQIFIEAFSAGGKIESMSGVTALGRPWTSLDARAPWERAVRASLAHAVVSVDAMVLRGADATRGLLPFAEDRAA